MVIMYDARKEGLFSVCNCTRGTVFYIVLQSPMFWMLAVIHAALLLTQQYLAANGSGLVPVDWKVATGSLSLLTFFLVFYSGNCYARYYQLHAHCVGINGGVMVWASHINAHFGRTLAAASRRQEITTPRVDSRRSHPSRAPHTTFVSDLLECTQTRVHTSNGTSCVSTSPACSATTKCSMATRRLVRRAAPRV